MSYIAAVIIALVYGLAEILPLSGSGHLYILLQLFGIYISKTDRLLLEAFMTLGAVITVTLVFRKQIGVMISDTAYIISAGMEDNAERDGRFPVGTRLLIMNLISLVPVLIGALLFRKASVLADNRIFLSIAMVVSGVILYASTFAPRGKRAVKTMRFSDAIIMGIGYAAGCLPGLSKSALVISSGKASGVRSLFAMRYCMLLFVPCALVTAAVKAITAVLSSPTWSLLPVFLVAMVLSAVGAFAALAVYDRILRNKGLKYCSYYLMLFGVAMLVLYFILPHTYVM